MKILIDFFRSMLLLPKPWVVWIGALIAANAIVPLFFFRSLEAQLVLGAIAIGAVIQIAVFRSKGFVRLLGIGHLLWVALVPWLWIRYTRLADQGPFAYWLVAVMVVNTVSLVIDATDVGRYIMGEREPQVRLD